MTEILNDSVKEVVAGCLSNKDVHCYLVSEGLCEGTSCEFYEQSNSEGYRKVYAKFPAQEGGFLEKVDLESLRFV